MTTSAVFYDIYFRSLSLGPKCSKSWPKLIFIFSLSNVHPSSSFAALVKVTTTRRLPRQLILGPLCVFSVLIHSNQKPQSMYIFAPALIKRSFKIQAKISCKKLDKTRLIYNDVKTNYCQYN